MRLIDADTLIQDIVNDNTMDDDTKNYYKNMVDGMETVFDVDGAVEQLEDKTEPIGSYYNNEY